ncbi:sugar phosphate isomerase/epimerase family protein [Paenibacillus sp. GCM10023252]|uniref:sugar phosphate isomerase/epimerase family protein n=1 Tax=Paenibacillus sp. GCM10023252 TaxID=3252649 RepID=UPI003615047A
MVEVTMLNVMAGGDFIQSLDTQRSWGVKVLDLKNGIYGKNLIDLSIAEAEQAANEIAARGLSVYCFSSELFHDMVEKGEAYFREQYLNRLDHLLKLAAIMKPKVIRLLSAKIEGRSEVADSISYLRAQHPWLIPMYGEAIDRIHAAGFEATVENEAADNMFSTPSEVTAFFEALARKDRVYFTYDVQNLWQMGTFPTIHVYEQLAPYIGFYHVKGGQSEGDDLALVWKSSLEESSWPVAAMTTRVVKEGRSPAICINPSHGKAKPDYDFLSVTKQDYTYVRSLIAQVEVTK